MAIKNGIVECDWCGEELWAVAKMPRSEKGKKTHFCNYACCEACITEAPEAFDVAKDEIPSIFREH